MKLQIDNLLRDLEDKLAKNNEQDLITYYAYSKELVLAILKEISDRIKNLGSQCQDEQSFIQYNKVLLAPLYGKLIYFDKCYRLEFYKGYLPPTELPVFIEKELRSICQFNNDHYEFCQYWDSGNTDYDWYYFTPHNCQSSTSDIKNLGLSPYINIGMLYAACYTALKNYGIYLQQELRRINTISSPLPHKKAVFQGNKADLVELATVLHASGDILVNQQPATQEYIISMLENNFEVDLENYRVVKAAIHKRKKDRFPYLNRLLSGGEQYFKALDDEKRPHKSLRSNQ